MRNRLAWLTLAISVRALAADDQGPVLTDIAQSRNLALGGAYESLGYGAESVSGNPAALSLYKRYQMEASGSWDIPNGYGMATVALADSTNALAAGVAYQYVTYGAHNRRWAHLTTGALALSLADWLHIGAAVRHQVILGATNTNSVTMNAGLVVRPAQFLSLGFSGHNLIYNYNPDITRYFVASVSAMLLGQLSPVFDLRMDFNQAQPRLAYLGGIEWLIAQAFPLRVGYQFDDILRRQYVSGGIGYFDQGSGIDLSYRHELAGSEGRMLSLTLKLQL